MGILAGLIWSLIQIPVPSIIDKTVENVARIATPLGLMAMGASFDIKKALSSIKTAGLSTFIKLAGLVCLFVPVAVALGFREDKLVAALIMCGSPSTVSCYVMAKNMGHDGTLTSSTVMLTTFFSAFTLLFFVSFMSFSPSYSFGNFLQLEFFFVFRSNSHRARLGEFPSTVSGEAFS